ncbi:TetR/AcrR family transcriptional regulator [Lentilactobacillus kosonis]|uniref:Transcriptional regulator, TetR family n=1 Tax=Lentilactobacillus kosonis TaxID=2810561 RepID=A0A401FHP5_9LACO|nr:TetR/AcrR family transcriptional regulator [Lentilactobacillus kosonis]GAY71883.1 transcriptional regulator, TetR family [Lentilactobacillus kosonis]
MDARQYKTERDIRQGCINLLAQKEFEKITIADICQEAIISRTTFYAHYVDKYALLEKLVIDYTTLFAEIAEKRINELFNQSKMDFSMSQIADELLEHKQALQALFRVHVKGLDLTANCQDILQRSWHHVINELELTSKAPEDYLAQTCTALILNFVKWTLANGKNASVITQLRQLMNTLFDQSIPY